MDSDEDMRPISPINKPINKGKGKATDNTYEMDENLPW